MLTKLYCGLAAIFVLIFAGWACEKLRYIENKGEVLAYLVLFASILVGGICVFGLSLTE